jgi:hypothetical protein
MVSWLPIDKIYSVSVDGQVKKNEKLMKGAFDTLGYRQVSQYGKLKMVHRLVASRFLPAPTKEGCEIDHIDRDKSNNHASNLRWCSKSDNMLNRNHKIPTTGEKYITLYTLKFGGIRYVLGLNKNKPNQYKAYFKTIEEAVIQRNLLLNL